MPDQRPLGTKLLGQLSSNLAGECTERTIGDFLYSDFDGRTIELRGVRNKPTEPRQRRKQHHSHRRVATVSGEPRYRTLGDLPEEGFPRKSLGIVLPVAGDDGGSGQESPSSTPTSESRVRSLKPPISIGRFGSQRCTLSNPLESVNLLHLLELGQMSAVSKEVSLRSGRGAWGNARTAWKGELSSTTI